MTPNEHLNAFCVLFAKLKEICDSGPNRRESQEAKDVRKKMYAHYPNVTDAMVKYLDQFTATLITLGFNFDEMRAASKIEKVNVADLDQSKDVQVTGKFEFAKVVDVSEKGKIYNYNEHSTPITKLSPQEFQELKQKTIQRIKKEQEMMFSGQRPKQLQPTSWGLPDEARDW